MTSQLSLGKSTSNVLLLDYDINPEEVIGYWKRWWYIAQFRWPVAGRLRVRKLQAWATDHGVHVEICLRNQVPLLLLIFIQALLGSDFKREALNFRRVVELEDTKNDLNFLFFEKWKCQPDGYDFRSEETPDRKVTRRLERIIRDSGRG